MKPDERLGISDGKEGALIDLRAVPRSSRTELFLGEDGLRMRIAAPPVGGAANAELVKYLAKTLGVPKSAVEIVSGAKRKRKRVLVREMTAEKVRETLTEVIR